MDAFTIKDLENLSGIKAHTIRIWEQRYQFLNPRRTGTNIRSYDVDELKTLLNVALLNKYGFKISHIDKMSEAEIAEKILQLSQAQAQHERTINELIKCMVDLNLDEFEEILDSYILARGTEKAILNIIFPFLDRVGILWATNHINPAQEHLVTNIIRQKLIVGIEGGSSLLKAKSSVLLFLPEGEYHELGLLFIYFLLKNRGVKVWYLGANVPMSDMAYVVNVKSPDYVFVHLTSVGSNFNFEKFLTQASIQLAPKTMVVSGQLARNYKKKLPANVSFKLSLQQMMDFVAGL